MTTPAVGVAHLDREELRHRISEKYRDVATNLGLGFHFHTVRWLARMLGYAEGVVASSPASSA